MGGGGGRERENPGAQAPLSSSLKQLKYLPCPTELIIQVGKYMLEAFKK